MAGRRIAKSAVNWAAFAERVPQAQTDAFRAFKAKSDHFVSNIHRFPENLPNIDWAYYQSRIALPGMVDGFQKAYQGVTVPYPSDKQNMKATVDQEQKTAEVETKKATADIKESIAGVQALLSKIDSLPHETEMTNEMYMDYFPDMARNPEEKPTFFPHTRLSQPANLPNDDH